jgi:putative DNA primase/helicase
MNIDSILQRFDGVIDDGDGWLALCPVHGDTNPSLRLSLTNEGRVLMVCRSQNCSFGDIVEAVGLTPPDFSNVDIWQARTITSVSQKEPANSVDLAQLDALITQLQNGYVNSEGSNYAWERWRIDEEMATQLRLGTVHPVDSHPMMQRQFARVMGVSVPLLGFDGKPRGLQRRSLFDDDDRWSTLANPADDRVWSRLGVMAHPGDDYIVACEGPGDALSCYAAGVSAVFLRGSSTMIRTAADELIENCRSQMIVLAGDADPAGHKFNRDLGQLLHDAGVDVRILDLPAGVGDLTDWLELEGGNFNQVLARSLRAAPPYIPVTALTTAPPPEPERFDFTDVGNGRRLAAYFEGDYLFSPELGRMIYRDGVWKADNLSEVPRGWKRCLDEMRERGADLIEYGNAIGNGVIVERGEVTIAYANRSSNEPKFSNGLKQADQDVSVDHDRFDRPLHLLNCANGTVDLRTGELKRHNREDYLSHQIDVPYDPDARAERWDSFLDEIFVNHPDLPKFMQTLVGYLATGEISEQCVVTCHGSGANGKSVLWGVIGSVLKDVTKYTTMATFEKRQAGAATADLAYLRGSRIVLTQESEANQAVSESTLKRVSGGDEISCRQLYRAPMSYVPQFSVVFALNHLFRIKGQDEGVWRRQILVPFSRFFEPAERDPDLMVKLIGESPGILKWIVEGSVDWYANGLTMPDVVTAATAEFRHGSDELAGFLGTVIEPDIDGEVLGAELMDRYITWCHEENTRPWTRTSLFNGVIERVSGAKRKRKTAGIALTGVSFVEGM